MRELWGSIAKTSGAKIYTMLVGVAFLSLTARWLGPEGRGQYAAVMAWVILFNTFGHLSLGQVAIHRASQNRSAENWLGQTLGSLLLMTGIISILGWTIALGLHAVTRGRIYGALPGLPLAIGFVGFPLYIWEQYGSSLLISLERVGIYNRYQMIGRTLGLACLVVFIPWAHWGVAGAVAAALIGQLIVAGGGMWFLIRRPSQRIRPSWTEMRELLRGGAKLHLNAIGAFAFGTIDILILNFYRGPQETGFYQLAVQFISLLMVVPQSAAMVIYGRVATTGPDSAWPSHRRILVTTVGLAIIGALALAVSAPLAISIIAGAHFKASVPILRWLLLGAVGMTFSTVMAPQWIGRGYFWQAALIGVGLGLAASVANLMVVPMFGVWGVVGTAIGVYGFSVVCNLGMVVLCNRRSRVLQPSTS